MALLLWNSFPAKIFVAFVYHDATCGPSNQWRKLGWWSLPSSPGPTVYNPINVWNIDLRTVNRYVGIYAEQYTDGGGATWDSTNYWGMPGPTSYQLMAGNYWYKINNGADSGFNQCFDDNSNCSQSANFIQVDFDGNEGIVVNFSELAGFVRVL